jgi:gas vesicle protein
MKIKVKEKNLGWLMVGLAAGTATGLYLNSKKGKKMRKKAAKKATDLSETAKEKISAVGDQSMDYLKQFQHSMGSAIRSGAETAKEKIEMIEASAEKMMEHSNSN